MWVNISDNQCPRYLLGAIVCHVQCCICLGCIQANVVRAVQSIEHYKQFAGESLQQFDSIVAYVCIDSVVGATAATTSDSSAASLPLLTQWRRRKAKNPGEKASKVRCCNLCQHPMGSAEDSQYNCTLYCPYIPGQLPEGEWLRPHR